MKKNKVLDIVLGLILPVLSWLSAMFGKYVRAIPMDAFIIIGCLLAYHYAWPMMVAEGLGDVAMYGKISNLVDVLTLFIAGRIALSLLDIMSPFSFSDWAKKIKNDNDCYWMIGFYYTFRFVAVMIGFAMVIS